MGWTRERIAVAGYFGLLGFVCSAWVSSLDDMKVLLDLTDGEQGLLLFTGPLGNLVSFSFANALILKLGVRRSLTGVGYAYLSAALALACCFRFRAPIVCWCFAIASLGCAGNVLNIAMNAQAGAIERRYGRPIMGSFHAMFSLWMLAGVFLAQAAVWLGISVGARLFAVIAAGFLFHCVAPGFLADADGGVPAPAARTRWFRPDRALLALGLVAFVIWGCEGTIQDWAGVFYRESLHAPERAKWGLCMITAMMAFGRLFSDRLIARFGPTRILHAFSVVVSAGLVVALGSPFTGLAGLPLHLLAAFGFAVVGLGLSGLSPIVYSQASRAKGLPSASALTFVSSMGFLGFFVSPPLVGRLSEWTNRSLALGVFAVLILVCLFIDPDRDRSRA